MGTRGFRIIRFRGKFYVFYNQLDSYPEGLGQWLVEKIPSDPEEYQQWLQRSREFYAKFERELDEHLLTIDNIEVPDDLDIDALDVESLPYALAPKTQFDIEWTYTIDLDQEVFSVWDAAHFRMNNIPRGVWIKSLKQAGPFQLTVATDIAPPDSIACPASISQHVDPQELADWRHRYQELTCSIVRAKAPLDPDVQEGFMSQCFRGLVYTYFCDAFRENFQNYSLTWIPQDFIFREMAFAMLSLASGQVRFAKIGKAENQLSLFWRPDRLKELAYVTVNEGDGIGGSTVLPKFAVGAHRPGELPGSAPVDTTYWFENVLVCLATGLDKRESCQAAIAKAVISGLRQGAADFQIVIVDLLYCVLMDVHMEDGKPVVRHSSPISLFPLRPEDHKSTHPGERPPTGDLDNEESEHEDADEGQGGDGDEEAGTEEDQGGKSDHPTSDGNEEEADKGGLDVFASQLSRKARYPFESPEVFSAHCPGFVALMDFFNVAAARRFRRQRTTQGVFPAEIYANILQYTDASTSRICAGVSWAFRSHYFRHYRIDDTYVLNRIEFTPKNYPVLSVLNTASGTVEDLRILRNEEHAYKREKGMQSWIPVVGSERPSILSQVSVDYVRSSEEEQGSGDAGDEEDEQDGDSDYQD